MGDGGGNQCEPGYFVGKHLIFFVFIKKSDFESLEWEKHLIEVQCILSVKANIHVKYLYIYLNKTEEIYISSHSTYFHKKALLFLRSVRLYVTISSFR